MFLLNRLLPSPNPPATPAPHDDMHTSCPQAPPPPRMRLTLTPHPSVYGHPPGPGGVLLLPRALAPVDLEFLGLPGIPAEETAPPAAGEEEEEAFCERMRLLGAEWWRGGEEEWEKARARNGERAVGKAVVCGWRESGVLGVGFEVGAGAAQERGGVWVYRVSRVRERPPAGREEAARGVAERGRRCARVCAARSMEEKCRVIRECGGEYFESVESWRKVALEEHVREGVVASDRDRLFRLYPEDFEEEEE